MESKTKNIKNSLGATWNASHLAVRLCALRHWKLVSMPPTTQSLCHPLTRAFHVAPRLFFMFFVFDSIHDSATMHNLSPLIFHRTATTAKTENSSTTVKEIKNLHKSEKLGKISNFQIFQGLYQESQTRQTGMCDFFGLSK